MDPVSEAKLGEVHPSLAEKIHQMETILSQENIVFRVTQGLRSWTQQADLYAQGRTNPGPIITNAPPGHSWHNFGMAVDLVPDDPTLAGFQADWNIEHPVWKRLLAVGTSVGLVEGAGFRTFPDNPHFQLTGNFPVSPDDEVRQLFRDGGMAGLWQESGL